MSIQIKIINTAKIYFKLLNIVHKNKTNYKNIVYINNIINKVIILIQK